MKQALEPWMPELAPGAMIGEFQVVELLQAGGLGAVYIVRPKEAAGTALWMLRTRLRWLGLSEPLIRDQQLGALKLARPAHEANLFDEQQHIAQFRHPHVVRAYRRSDERSVSLLGGRVPRPIQTISLPDQAGKRQSYSYMVMRLEAGGTLDRLLRQTVRPWAPGGRPLKAAAAVMIARQIAQALEYLHSRHRVVHQDVTPKNIVFRHRLSRWQRSEIHAVLIDFGIMESLSVDVKLRQQSFMTTFFVAPERLSQARPNIHSDMYSLGMVLYVMLMGRHKAGYAGDTYTKDRMVINTLPGQVPERVKSLVLRCTEPDLIQRERHFPSMQSVVHELEAIERELGSTPLIRLPWRWQSKAAAALGLLALPGFAWALEGVAAPLRGAAVPSIVPTITARPTATSALPTLPPTLPPPTSTRLPRPADLAAPTARP